jgi:eukaryotic-like serine/threonine-protein kinase
MTTERDRDDLLASISDGQPADWDAAERAASDADRPRLAVLHGLSRIAEFNRELQRAPEDRAGPARWGELVLLECLGTGGRGEVWRAWDPALEREVALKLMHSGLEDALLLEEGRNLARVRHPNVVHVLGVDRRDDRVGMWMELVRGSTLEQLVRAQGPLEPREARRVGLEMGEAVAAVHAAGLVHRDIKPANVIRDVEGRYVLTDFGLGLRDGARVAGFARPSGTPMYMAPEVLAGATASEQSDVYSLGMLLWFALAGRHPFEVQTLDDLATAASKGPRPALRDVRAGIPGALANVVEQAIAPDPRQRFVAVRPMLAALERWQPRRSMRPRDTLVAAIAALALLVAIVVAVRQATVRPAAVTSAPVKAPPAPSYTVEASLTTRDDGRPVRLVSGDRVRPGQHLWLDVRVTRPAWVYVLDEDERGERYLLYPQPRFATRNPLRADSAYVLPGTVEGREYAWTVTSAGGREHVLVIASPSPIAEIEADLARMPRAESGRPIAYAPIGSASVEHLRGIGGMSPSSPAPASAPPALVFDRFRALAGREADVQGVWIRQIVLENPRR